MTRAVVALALLAACSSGAAREPRAAPYDPEEHRHGPLIVPEGEQTPPPDATLVDPPPAEFGDDLAPPVGAGAATAERFDAAARAYDLGDFNTAIDELVRAYELEPHVEYLFDIAQAYRLIGHVTNALFFYRRYAAVTRDDATAIDVSVVIEDLEVILEQQQPPPD